MIELKNIFIGYGSKGKTNSVFKNLNATFNKGELIGLVGNNGVGKSTFIKTIFGTLKPLDGEILLDERSLSNFSVQELAKHISIVLTDKVGGFNLTVYDVVAAGRIPYLNAFAQLTEEDHRITEKCLAQIGITELKEKLVDELSDGQRQKVMIAKSLAQQTPVILLDEPTAFLDYNSKRQLFDILKDLCKNEQKTIVVSSHDLEILFKNVDKALYMKPNNEFLFDVPAKIQSLII